MLHWPLLLFSLLALTHRTYRPLALLLILFLASVLALSELVHLGDSGGRYLRFNTTLKWWSLLHIGVIGGLAAIALDSSIKWVRGMSVILLLLLNLQVIDLARYWFNSDKPHFGQLSGLGTLSVIPGYEDIHRFLRQSPPGVVLEQPKENRGAYNPVSAVALLAGKPVFLGWADHLRNWGRSPAEVNRRVADIAQFYEGKHPHALEWLTHNQIRYIVWNEHDNRRHPKAFEAVQQQIGDRYHWHEFRSGDPWRTGLWERR
jgi:uncharacterized membrane protein